MSTVWDMPSSVSKSGPHWWCLAIMEEGAFHICWVSKTSSGIRWMTVTSSNMFDDNDIISHSLDGKDIIWHMLGGNDIIWHMLDDNTIWHIHFGHSSLEPMTHRLLPGSPQNPFHIILYNKLSPYALLWIYSLLLLWWTIMYSCWIRGGLCYHDIRVVYKIGHPKVTKSSVTV